MVIGGDALQMIDIGDYATENERNDSMPEKVVLEKYCECFVIGI